ncbi:MAG: HAD family hydrolase [Actinobacteria bacterium]|nr:MAG: HAD family hydrolase [Actinomycetota bacterium]
MGLRAVIFDIGGVVTASPMAGFREYEARAGLPDRFVSEVIVAGEDDSAWSRLERGELSWAEFCERFEAECAERGETVDARELFAAMRSGTDEPGPRPAMVTAIRRIRARGLRTAALTNNFRLDDPTVEPGTVTRGALAYEEFDLVVESSVEGLRKPDPRIYLLVCERLEVEPHEAAFLDDLGVNLKAARALGMTTIKVDDPAVALAELEAVLGFALT